MGLLFLLLFDNTTALGSFSLKNINSKLPYHEFLLIFFGLGKSVPLSITK